MAGSIIVTLALVFSLFSMVMYFLSYRGANNTLNIARLSYHAMTMCVIIASAFFLYIILTHQYQYKYVYEYSSDDLSLGFLISTFWAGQEGSFTLWLLLTSVIGIFLLSYASKRGDLEPRVMTVFTLSTSFLLIMISPLMKNPFAYIWVEPNFIDVSKINSALFNLPFLQNFMFSDQNGHNLIKMDSNLYAMLQSAGISINDFIIHGKGLNPLLQNFWMQIHPPILFLGFALSAVPFAFAISALLKNDYKDWVKQSLPWILAGSGILGLGIMLGGYWAYGVLGWGGYWAWDPVENSSLVPWIVSVAAIHTLIVQRKSQAVEGGIGKFAKTNLILCILIYVLILYSTFLTRSGVLGDSSVHSFVDPGKIVYMFLIIFAATFLLLGAGMIIYRWKHLSSKINMEESLLSRELALFTAAVALCASALIILIGTSAPIFGQSVQTSFYSRLHISLAIIIGVLNGLSLLLKWNETKGKELIKQSYFSITATIIFAFLIIIFGRVHNLMMIMLTMSAAFTIFINAETAFKIFKVNKNMLGSYIAHIGFALFILGVVGSAVYSKEVTLDLEKGTPVKVFGYTFEFSDIQPFANDTKYALIINVKKDKNRYQVKPVMYISSFNNGLMREPDILSWFTKDLYVSPLEYNDGSQSDDKTGETNKNQKQENSINIGLGEQAQFDNVKITYKEFIKPDLTVMESGGDFRMGTRIILESNGKTYTEDILMRKVNNQMQNIPVVIKDAGIKIELKNVDPSSKKAELIISKIEDNTALQQPKEVLSVTASIKPFISLVWIGVGTMVIGFVVSMVRRLKESLL